MLISRWPRSTWTGSHRAPASNPDPASGGENRRQLKKRSDKSRAFEYFIIIGQLGGAKDHAICVLVGRPRPEPSEETEFQFARSTSRRDDTHTNTNETLVKTPSLQGASGHDPANRLVKPKRKRLET